MSFYKEVPGRKTTLESTLKFDTAPTAGSTNPVTSDGVANAVADVLDDHATGQVTQTTTMPAAEADSYTVGNYFEQNGKIWKCTAKTGNGDGTWTVEAEKVNGIVPVLNEPNIKNVQSDWNQTNALEDSFIKNKPYFSKYVESTTIYRICSFSIADSNSSSFYEGIFLTMRYGNSGVWGTLCYKNGLSLKLNSNVNISEGFKVRFYALTVGYFKNIYAVSNAFVNLRVAPIVYSNRIDFGAFGQNIEALPEGAEEITSLWVANNSDSSGDTPVKVDGFGNLTPVTMDNYPTSGSTALVNSGKLYDVFTDDNGDQMTETPPQQVYVTGKFYFVNGKVCRCTAYSASSATFDVYGVVEAMNYILGQT